MNPIPVSEGLPLMPDDICLDRDGDKVRIIAIGNIDYDKQPITGVYLTGPIGDIESFALDGQWNAEDNKEDHCDLVTIISRGPETAEVDRQQRMRKYAEAMFLQLLSICEDCPKDMSGCKKCDIYKLIKKIEEGG